MKVMHIVGIFVIAAAIAMLVTVTNDFSTFSTFEEASLAMGSENQFRVSGQLAKDKEMYYNPEEDPNYFSFYLLDRNKEERKVILKNSKPQDFERSEEIVLTGYMEGEDFHATDMLMKCPSKYTDEEVHIKSKI